MVGSFGSIHALESAEEDRLWRWSLQYYCHAVVGKRCQQTNTNLFSQFVEYLEVLSIESEANESKEKSIRRRF
jgi:hypothetical protein